MQQLPKSRCVVLSNMRKGGSSKQPRPCLYVVQFEIVIGGGGGGWAVMEILFGCFFHEEKTDQLKPCKIPRSFLLT